MQTQTITDTNFFTRPNPLEIHITANDGHVLGQVFPFHYHPYLNVADNIILLAQQGLFSTSSFAQTFFVFKEIAFNLSALQGLQLQRLTVTFPANVILVDCLLCDGCITFSRGNLFVKGVPHELEEIMPSIKVKSIGIAVGQDAMVRVEGADALAMSVLGGNAWSSNHGVALAIGPGSKASSPCGTGILAKWGNEAELNPERESNNAYHFFIPPQCERSQFTNLKKSALKHEFVESQVGSFGLGVMFMQGKNTVGLQDIEAAEQYFALAREHDLLDRQHLSNLRNEIKQSFFATDTLFGQAPEHIKNLVFLREVGKDTTLTQVFETLVDDISDLTGDHAVLKNALDKIIGTLRVITYVLEQTCRDALLIQSFVNLMNKCTTLNNLAKQLEYVRAQICDTAKAYAPPDFLNGHEGIGEIASKYFECFTTRKLDPNITLETINAQEQEQNQLLIQLSQLNFVERTTTTPRRQNTRGNGRLSSNF